VFYLYGTFLFFIRLINVIYYQVWKGRLVYLKKIIYVLLVAAVATFAGACIFADESITNVAVVIDDVNTNFPDSQPFIDENGRTLIPLPSLAEMFDCNSIRDEENNAAYIFTENDGEQTVVKITAGGDVMQLGRREYNRDGVLSFIPVKEIKMDAAAAVKGHEIFIPLRFAAMAFGYSVEWNGETNTVSLKRNLGNMPFGYELFSEMPKDKNYMLSPFSLKMAIAMAANGADGDTKDEILKAFGIDDLDLFNKIAVDFIESSNNNDLVEFNIANSIWNNTDNTGKDFGFSDAYKKLIEDYYKGTAGDINNESGAKTINEWIAAQTNEKIKNVITDTAVRNSISFLVNTIYFKGDWAIPFKSEATKEALFTDRNGKESKVLFMNDIGYYSYFEDENLQVLAKPYKDSNIKMYFALPKNNEQIRVSALENAMSQTESKYVRLKLPKFKTEYLHENLIDILKDLGVNAAFSPSKANFWSMYNKRPDGGENIFIGLILQKTFIEVDEKGTEAAAATVIGMETTSIRPSDPIAFECDKPFAYFIRNDVTGDILFMGEYAFTE